MKTKGQIGGEDQCLLVGHGVNDSYDMQEPRSKVMIMHGKTNSATLLPLVVIDSE